MHISKLPLLLLSPHPGGQADPTSYTSPQADCSAQLRPGVPGSDFAQLPLLAEKDAANPQERVKRACPRSLAVKVSSLAWNAPAPRERTSLSRTAPAPPAGGAPRRAPRAHPLVDVLPAGLILLLHTLLQEVDAQLEAEVLLLQVIEVLRQSAISIRHGGHPWGGACPVPPSAQHRAQLPRGRDTAEATATWPGRLARARGLGTGWLLWALRPRALSFFTSGRYLRNS